MFNTVEETLKDIAAGKMVIVVDDEDRENEGDLVQAAQFVTPESINFMAKYGRGLICVPMRSERLDKLKIFPMAANDEDRFRTAWSISVDAKEGVSTGISAHDRAATVAKLIDSSSAPDDFARPGHIFPLRAKGGGVLVRAGHTEASVDMASLAGLYPAGVICEIMNEDGTMSRVPELIEFSKTHSLKICTIKDLIEYRLRSETLIEAGDRVNLPTDFGDFELSLYTAKNDGAHHLALIKGDVSSGGPVLVRVHSECLTGDVFSSKRCDCGKQLDMAMNMVDEEGRGIILYMRQEGRGIGLDNKIKTYVLQDQGMDTVEANEALGFKPDLRDYGIGAQILKDLGVHKIRLITNNPKKVVGLEGYGINIVDTVPIQGFVNPHNERYLKTKKDKLGHNLDF